MDVQALCIHRLNLKGEKSTELSENHVNGQQERENSVSTTEVGYSIMGAQSHSRVTPGSHSEPNSGEGGSTKSIDRYHVSFVIAGMSILSSFISPVAGT